jgi:hypothetical protein
MAKLKTALFGLQKSDIQGKTVLELGSLYIDQLERTTIFVGVVVSLLLIGGGIASLLGKVNVSDVIPFAALLLAFPTLNAVRLAGVMPMLQMTQAEQHRRESAALISSVECLTREIRLSQRRVLKSRWQQGGHR